MATTLRKHNRRPPRDPSAAVRPKGTLEKAAMNSFKQKLQAANQVSICNTTSNKVGRMPLRQILTMDAFCVPIFQRRYCWTQLQWQTLLADASTSTTNPSSSSSQPRQPHSLGRLTCTRTYDDQKLARPSSRLGTTTSSQAKNQNRSCILDGQQRFTTTTILLAAIRDVWQELPQQAGGSAPASTNITSIVDGILFMDPIKLRGWLYHPESKLEEGVELPFARLVPTYCDRWAYYAAILPTSASKGNSKLAQSLLDESSISAAWDRPLQSKRYFLDKLRQEYASIEKLQTLLTGVLDGVDMLYFPIDLHQGHDDGTEDLMVIYERLAWRDAMFCQPKRGKEESKSMAGADMIRNLLLGSFGSQGDALDFYKEFWLPMEKLTIIATEDVDKGTASAAATSSDPKSIEQVITAFLKDRQQQDESGASSGEGAELPATAAAAPPLVGGKIYQDFQAWFSTQTSNQEEDGPATEAKVRIVGQKLLHFTQTFLSSDP